MNFGCKWIIVYNEMHKDNELFDVLYQIANTVQHNNTRVLPSVVLMGKKETLSTYLKAPMLTLPAGHYQPQKLRKILYLTS